MNAYSLDGMFELIYSNSARGLHDYVSKGISPLGKLCESYAWLYPKCRKVLSEADAEHSPPWLESSSSSNRRLSSTYFAIDAFAKVPAIAESKNLYFVDFLT